MILPRRVWASPLIQREVTAGRTLTGPQKCYLCAWANVLPMCQDVQHLNTPLGESTFVRNRGSNSQSAPYATTFP